MQYFIQNNIDALLNYSILYDSISNVYYSSVLHDVAHRAVAAVVWGGPQILYYTLLYSTITLHSSLVQDVVHGAAAAVGRGGEGHGRP